MGPQDEVAPKDIGPWIQDALDSLEFAMGPANSTWGSVRAAMGRPEPWDIPYFAIGNEVRSPSCWRDPCAAGVTASAEGACPAGQ